MTILQPVLQPVLRPLLADPLAPGFGDSLTAAVKAMFASGEKGVMFDLTRAANLYTDSARTTLVSASGDGVGSVTDLSPNAKHGSSTGSARPTWNSAGYATFDAFDDYLQTAAIDFTATDAVTVVAAVRKLSDAAAGTVAILGGESGSGYFSMKAPYTASPRNSFNSVGSLSAFTAGSVNFPSPASLVLTGVGDISADTSILSVNGVTDGTSASDQGTGSYRSDILFVGARGAGSQFFNGRIYRLLVIGRALTATERSLAERWAAQPVGITIP